MRRTQLYWICQVTGWSAYAFLNFFFFGLETGTSAQGAMYFLMLPVGLLITHLYRLLLLKLNFSTRAFALQLLMALASSFIMGGLFFVAFLGISTLVSLPLLDLSGTELLLYTFNFSGIFLLWNLVYFAFQYFQNYRRSEIAALRHLAASREAELNNLKAQLNPHFIFNCMNSIRALIDENPQNAKAAVTRLSNILRTTLMIDKSKEIALRDELKLVQDYLDLEKVRFEERLNYLIEADSEVQSCLIPPFIIQTQVENAVKHGISRLPGNGMIRVEARRETKGVLLIKVSNTGHISSRQPLTGVGFMNSIQRLELLYGKHGQISIDEEGEMVVVDINIPIR